MEIVKTGDGEWFNKETGEHMDKDLLTLWIISNACDREDFEEHYA